jgi:hypothetical protein
MVISLVPSSPAVYLFQTGHDEGEHLAFARREPCVMPL